MAAANTTVFEFLGKSVSFDYVRHMQLTEQSSISFREHYSGVVTVIVLSLDGEPQIAVADLDLISFSHIENFTFQ